MLQAVEELQAADSATRYWRRQVAAQRAAAQANDEVSQLTLRTFQLGGTVLTDVLDADRRALDNRTALAVSLRDLSKTSLQVATGRGWADRLPPAEVPTQ